MRLLCSFGWHRPSSRVIPNEGRLFSRCVACKADIIMVGRSWRTAPKGYQVVWKGPPAPAAPDASAETGKKPRKSAPRLGERRNTKEAKNPTTLGGKDRPGESDRRKGSGKKRDGGD